MVMARSFWIHGSVCLIPMIPRGGGPSPYRTRKTLPNTPRITFEGGDDDNTVEAVSAVAFARGVDARILDRFNSALVKALAAEQERDV